MLPPALAPMVYVKYGRIHITNKWECYGSKLWNYLEEALGIPESKISVRHENGSISAKYLKTMSMSNGVDTGK